MPWKMPSGLKTPTRSVTLRVFKVKSLKMRRIAGAVWNPDRAVLDVPSDVVFIVITGGLSLRFPLWRSQQQ